MTCADEPYRIDRDPCVKGDTERSGWRVLGPTLAGYMGIIGTTSDVCMARRDAEVFAVRLNAAYRAGKREKAAEVRRILDISR